jgi:hypothetical protein
MTAVVDYGAPFVFPSIAAPVREDGSSAFTPSFSISEQGVTLLIDAAFTINSTRVGELTGTVNEVWRLPNVTGEGRIAQTIVSTTRTATSLSGVSAGTARHKRVLRRLAAQDR